MVMLSTIGAVTSVVCVVIGCTKIATESTTNEAIKILQRKIRDFLAIKEPTFDVYTDPQFITDMKNVVRDYSVLTPEQSYDSSGYHSGLPYYAVQLKLKNEEDKEKVIQIMKKLIRNSLTRNGFPDSEVLIDFPDYAGFPGIEGRYSCTTEQRKIIQRVLDLEKKNVIESCRSIRDQNLDQELSSIQDNKDNR